MELSSPAENTRLPSSYQDAVRNSEQLRLINEVSVSITSILSLDELLREVVTSIQRTFGYYYVGLSLVENNSLVIKASAGRIAPVIHPDEIALPIGYGSCIGVCVGENRSMLVPDVRIDPNYRWYKELTESKSLIAAPLRFKGEVIGILSAESDQVEDFDQADLSLLESLSNHVAVAVENAYVYEKAQRRAAEVTALLEMAQDLNSHLEMSQLLRRMTERALSLTRASAGLAFQIEDDELVGHEYFAEGRWRPVEWRLSLENQHLENTLKTKTHLLIDAQELLPYPAEWKIQRARSALFVPIHSRDGILFSMICLMAMQPDAPFNPGDVSLVTALANQAAIALENARIFALEREKVEALRELDQLKTNFLNSVSHDLRTPLTALKTCSEALLEISAGDEMSKHRQLIKNINRNVERITGLVSDILEMATLQSGNLRLNYELINLAEMLLDLVETIRPLTEKKNQSISLATSSQDIWVMADPRRIEQVVMNLLSNAERFTPERGSIEIRLLEQPNNVLVSVTNSGPPIPRPDQERIFERFYRLAVGGKDRARGIGLGLSIARSLIELHRGQIWVESPVTAQGDGTTFIFTLPKEIPDGIHDR